MIRFAGKPAGGGILDLFQKTVASKIARETSSDHLPCFPLTLTRREREQPLADLLKFVSQEAEDRRGFARKLGAFLTLPTGESRGEGKLYGEPINLKNVLLC